MLNPTKIDPNDIPTFAPDVVVTRADHDVAKPQPDLDIAPSIAPKGADGAAGAKAPPVDTTFRATSAEPAKPARTAKPAKARGQRSFGRRLVRGAIGMILTACVAGAAVLLQSHGDFVRQIVAKSVSPVIVALLSRESPAAEQPSAVPAVQGAAQVSAATTAPAPSAPQSAGNNFASTAPTSSTEQAELLQSLARDLAHLRQDMEQMRTAIAELKSSDDQMAREIAKASDRATDKALEQALRPRVSMVSPPQAQPVAARKPPPVVARPVQPRPPQVATSYVPRPADARAMAPPPPVAAPPMDISAPRPPAPLREQVP